MRALLRSCNGGGDDHDDHVGDGDGDGDDHVGGDGDGGDGDAVQK